MFWGVFVALLILLDLLLIVKSQNNVRTKLMIQWVLISSPLSYWAIKYGEWIFAIATFAFFITQLVRAVHISKSYSRPGPQS